VHYIVDGYNFLFRLPKDRKASLEQRRQSLIDSLCEELSEFSSSAQIVFDSKEQVCDFAQSAKYPHLDVIYAPCNQSADDYILELVEHAKNPKNITVVTSDSELARHCRYLEAKSLTIEDFLHLIRGKQEKRASPKEVKQKKEIPSEMARLRKIFEEKLRGD